MSSSGSHLQSNHQQVASVDKIGFFSEGIKAEEDNLKELKGNREKHTDTIKQIHSALLEVNDFLVNFYPEKTKILNIKNKILNLIEIRHDKMEHEENVSETSDIKEEAIKEKIKEKIIEIISNELELDDSQKKLLILKINNRPYLLEKYKIIAILINILSCCENNISCLEKSLESQKLLKKKLEERNFIRVNELAKNLRPDVKNEFLSKIKEKKEISEWSEEYVKNIFLEMYTKSWAKDQLDEIQKTPEMMKINAKISDIQSQIHDLKIKRGQNP
jgi:hypothetical protein